MKNLLITFLIFLSFAFVKAQDADTQQDNNDVLLGVFVPDQIEPITPNVKRLLNTRMYQMVTANGISGNAYTPRFYLLPRIAVLDKEILGTAPPRVILNLELTLFIGDREEEKGNVFETETITLKGVGENEQKAYIAAIRTIRPKNPTLVNFMERTKKEIINYYEQYCDAVKKKAYALEAQDETEEAVKVIANIPITTECYTRNERDIRRFYQKVLDQQCTQQLNKARAIWYANQSVEGANKAAEELGEIAPRAYCKDELNKLYNEIATRVREIDGKEWDFKLKLVDARAEDIRYTRELVLKYFDNRPPKKVVYRFTDW